MGRRKQEDDVDPDGPPSYEDKIIEQVVFTAYGKNLEDVIANARLEAGKALGTRPENVYISSSSPLIAAATARFEDRGTILWKARVTCGVVPPELRIG